ncbi:MAG: hypothetical protein JOZ32_03490 [Bryobacterales bacterium]|nr:hypothetical protein [Bryobacterales bacterium]
MSTFSLTDDFNNPVPVPVNWTSPSALFKYLKSEGLHLIVFPDFIQHKDQLISQITPQPLQARLKVGYKFQLGGTLPEIDVTPEAQVSVEVNAKAGSNLFSDDPFSVAATVPPNVAYVGLTLDGSLDLDVSGVTGYLTFGFDHSSELSLGYWRAFPANGASEPTLGDAFAQAISNYVIPTSLADLKQLRQDDICTASGTGSITVSGEVQVTATPNPLASVNLPLNAGTITVQEGAMAGLTFSFMIKGSYQMRVRRLDSNTIELSFLKQSGTTLKTDLTGSAGVSVKKSDTGKDLIGSMLGAIDPKTDNSQLLQGGLTAEEAQTLSDAIKSSIDHSLQASFDATLAQVTDDQAVFQYHIDLDAVERDPVASEAVQRALKGDLSYLTALEAGIKADGTIAAGVKVISTVFSTSVAKGVTFKINLLGLLNVLSLSDLIRGSKIIPDPVTGDLTIADSVTGTQIQAIVEPPKREEMLRKAMFESLVVTAAYKASGAIEAFNLTSQAFHFALNQNTNIGVMTDYLNWLAALNLITSSKKQEILSSLHGQGLSTCLLRTSLTDAQCRSMFFDEQNNLRGVPYYLEYGRRAMIALLNDKIEPFDQYRYALLNQQWERALQVGASPELAQVAGLTTENPDYQSIVMQLIGDVYDLTWWASGMVEAGKQLQSMSTFLAGRNPSSLKNDPAFESQRSDLQKKMAQVIGKSKARFTEPWGLVSIFWAAGSEGASARLVTPAITLDVSTAVRSFAA